MRIQRLAICRISCQVSARNPSYACRHAHYSLAATQITQNDLQKKNHELAEALREKTRKHNQMQELYNKLKRRTLYSRAQTAASEAVDQSLPGNANRIREHMSSMQNSQHFRAPLSPQRHYVDRVLPGERAIFGQPRRPEVNLRESGVGLSE